ncbi:hypothetical protein [Paenibacillus naphthalenovorans]|uniref:hypothetical protein n=1 Tax=Paenibacillus naphthalenovorans TaxID=162209 RepID=UPI003D274654
MTLKCGAKGCWHSRDGVLASGRRIRWHERKLAEESKLAECFAILENGLRTERDIACFEALKAALEAIFNHQRPDRAVDA